VLSWASVFVDPLTTEGDLVYRDANGTTRLPIGSDGQVLTVQNDGSIAWQIAQGGGGSSSSITDGTSTVDFENNNIRIDASIIPDTNSAYDLGSAEKKIRHLYLSDNSIKFEDGDVGVNGEGKLTFQTVPLATRPVEYKPVITAVNPDNVVEGDYWSAKQLVADGLDGVVWHFYGYTGNGTVNVSSTSGIATGIANSVGTHSFKVRAAWPFGMSDEAEVTFNVSQFVLTQDTMFGGLSGLTAFYDFNSISHSDYEAVIGAVIQRDGGFVFDDGTTLTAANNFIAFYSPVANRLIAYRHDTFDAVEGIYYWDAISDKPGAGSTPLSNGGVEYQSDATLLAAAVATSIQDKAVPIPSLSTSGIGSSYYLRITPAANEFAGFGGKATDWSYGFLLKDDWIACGSGSQLLSPVGDSEYFVSAIEATAIFNSSISNEYVLHGDYNTAVAASSFNEEVWDISANGWKIAAAGDLVVITYDGASQTADYADRFRVYVNGTLIFSTGEDTAGITPTADNPTATELRFGDAGGSAQTHPPDQANELAGWYSRLDSLFIANGTVLDQNQINDLVANKTDLTQATNYDDLTTLGTFTDVGVTNTKGNVAYGRGAITYS